MIMVRTPARRPGIRSRVAKTPVRAPAMRPAPPPTSAAKNGLNPRRIRIPATAAPRGNVPSTERSGKERTRKER